MKRYCITDQTFIELRDRIDYETGEITTEVIKELPFEKIDRLFTSFDPDDQIINLTLEAESEEYPVQRDDEFPEIIEEMHEKLTEELLRCGKKQYTIPVDEWVKLKVVK